MAAASPNRALLIAGPTATGKSALALRLAAERQGVIINADALQVYRELRILSARPTPEEERKVPHRLYGHVSGHEPYSVARWLEDAAREIRLAWQQESLPILVGGTGLYFKALLGGLTDIPDIPAEIRAKWRSFEGDLWTELARRDEAEAVRLAPTDRQRLIRALEVIEATGRSLADWQKHGKTEAPLAGVEVERLIVMRPRQELYARAEARFDRMLEEGALGEVRPLLGLDPALPMLKAIGLPELAAHLRGDLSLDEAIARAKISTRHYIKRQFTWWRGQMKDWTVAGQTA